MQKRKLFADVIGSAVQFILLITYAKSQDEEGLAVVTSEMFSLLQSEVDSINNDMVNLQDQVQALAVRIQNVATTTTQVGGAELAELNALIDVAKRQEDDIAKLVYSNGIWQQNFRVINSTFEKLRKVVVFPIPNLNNAPQATAAVRRNLKSITLNNTSIIHISTLKPLMLSKKVIGNKIN